MWVVFGLLGAAAGGGLLNFNFHFFTFWWGFLDSDVKNQQFFNWFFENCRFSNFCSTQTRGFAIKFWWLNGMA
jgi:hypothetical protein